MATSASQELNKIDQHHNFDKFFFIQNNFQVLLTCPPPLFKSCVASPITRLLHASSPTNPSARGAKRLGISLPTLIHLKRGEPTVSPDIYATAL